jgi:nitrous oxidase accessory protein NosD
LHGHTERRVRSIRLVKAGLTGTIALVFFLSTAALAAAKTLYVSPKGKATAACTKAAPCKTIGQAVAKAAKRDTVSVAKGTYAEGVTITKDISVVGVGHPVVDAAGQGNGFLISGKGATGTLVRGFVIEHATFEGILAMKTARLTIEDNTIRDNDLGITAANPVGECKPFGGGPGDCGEGLHLMSVTRSVVSSNTLTGNLGGILMTDEFGPTAHNVISKNHAIGNRFDCGITLAGHNPAAAPGGKPKPSKAGVYANTINGNVVNGNGTKGEGAGILLAGAAPGTAVYDNVVSGNTANGNGLAGITLHSHAPGQDLNGNKITSNKLSHDGVADTSEAEFGGADFAKAPGQTVGILIGSNVTKLKGTVVSGNTISNTHFGIYTKNVPAIKQKANTFHHVSVALKQL